MCCLRGPASLLAQLLDILEGPLCLVTAQEFISFIISECCIGSLAFNMTINHLRG